MARASSAKKTGGNWLPVARACDTAIGDMRELYKTVLHMRELAMDLSDAGMFSTPAPAEWDLLLDHVQVCADRLRLGLKGRG